MLILSVVPLTLAVCKLPADEASPAWAMRSDFFAVLRTPGELTAVTTADCVPDGVVCARGWRALKLEGTFDFALTGILASILQPLAEAGVGIFALSTFDTDYVLVKDELLEKAIAALRAAGHAVRE